MSASPSVRREDCRLAFFKAQGGTRFNGGRPHPTRWLLPRTELPAVKERLRMLGDAVVPLQAHLAAVLLDL